MKVKGVLPALVCVVDSRVVNHKMVPETKTLFIFCLFTKQIARPLYSLAFLANCHHNHMFKAFLKIILYNIKTTNFTHYIKFYVHSSRIRVRTLALQICEWREQVREISRGSIILGRFGGKAGSGNKERKNTGSCSSRRSSK